jgi:hypothetical protein
MAAGKSYQHSRVFESMKNTKEAIQDNLTSLQYLQTLDFFLWESLKPIAAECPSFFYNYLVKVVARQSLKASVKLTSSDRQKLPIVLFNTLCNPIPSKAFEQSRQLYLNRGVLFGFTSLFLRKLKFYMELHQSVHEFESVSRNTLIYRIEQQMGLRNKGNLYPALLQVMHWDTKARWWKEMIIEKYTRMAVLQAQNTYKDFNHFVPLDDVVQVYMVVVSRAIDRCDARQGVLTTFIQNWFKSARGEIGHMAESQQDISYESLTEDHGDAIHDIIGVTLPDLTEELRTHIAYIASTIDRIGLVRTALGIPQFVTRAQRSILEEFVLEETT